MKIATYKIATWNVNSLKARLEHVLQWLEDKRPDILALQELKMTNENFPLAAINDAGYQVAFSGQKAYNGVAILSRDALTDIVLDLPNYDDPQRRVLVATLNGIRIINVYVPNGSSIDSDKYVYKLAWLESLYKFVEVQLQEYKDLIVLGDFNIAPDDRDVYDPIAWKDQVLVSQPERAALQKLMDLGLVDTFRLFHQDQHYSWWDYRQAAFRRNMGLRIDHILASSALAKRCTAAEIDKTPRKWERPSDHAPVMAEFSMPQS
ncbi:MAG: exodeoxyribonuclease III [Gammaproteobacteria bacterium]|nr:exodeoxyribonuclease III [Gammaproteobacteria bacterium]